MVNTDFRAGIDAVLSFPKFNQPCAAPIIKIDGEGVEYHLEAGRQIIVEPGVPGLTLGGIHCGGKKAAVTVKIVSEGIYQLVYKRTFGAAVHPFNLADYFFSAALKEDTAENSHEK